jgi:hypothetical protein
MLEIRWDGPRVVELVVRGSVREAPVYAARLRGMSRAHGFEREFLGSSRLIEGGRTEEITLPVSALRPGDILEVRDGTPLERSGIYERFLLFDGARFSRVEMAYALHAMRRLSSAAQ